MTTLSKSAQEVLNVLLEVKNNPLTPNYIAQAEDRGWLEAGNIVNGHVQAPAEYVLLMEKLMSTLDGNLIDSEGQHSDVFYELRRAGYRLRTGESDSFGPLSSVITIPDTEWNICYG